MSLAVMVLLLAPLDPGPRGRGDAAAGAGIDGVGVAGAAAGDELLLRLLVRTSTRSAIPSRSGTIPCVVCPTNNAWPLVSRPLLAWRSPTSL